MWRRWLCVVAALTFSHSDGHDMSMSSNGPGACVNALTGQQTDETRSYAYVLQPQRQYFTIEIPSFQGCHAVGASVSVCEPGGGGAGAALRLQGLARALVRRAPARPDPATAYVLVYCG